MTLNELKQRMEITDDSQDELLSLKLDGAINYVQEYCKQDFIIEEELQLPNAIKDTIPIIIQAIDNARKGKSAVQTKRVDIMQVSYHKGHNDMSIADLLAPFIKRRVSFL